MCPSFTVVPQKLRIFSEASAENYNGTNTRRVGERKTRGTRRVRKPTGDDRRRTAVDGDDPSSSRSWLNLGDFSTTRKTFWKNGRLASNLQNNNVLIFVTFWPSKHAVVVEYKTRGGVRNIYIYILDTRNDNI